MLQLLALLSYVLHFLNQLRSNQYPHWLFVPLVAGVLLQATELVTSQLAHGFGFFQLVSFTALGCVVTVLLLQIATRKYAFMQLWFVPIACFTLLLDHFVTNIYLPPYINTTGLVLHVFFSITALSLVSISSTMLFCGAVRDKQLKHIDHRQWSIIPAIETLKTTSKTFLLTAWIALTLAIVSGSVFIEDFLEQHLAHKTFFTMLSWLLLSFLLVWLRQHTLAWKRVFLLCLTVNISLILGYFGSRFVLEFIIQ